MADVEKAPEVGPRDEKENEPILASKERILVGGIWLDLVDLPEGSPPFQMKDGKISIDKSRFGEEQKEVKKALFDSIQNGDRKTFDKLTSGLGNAEAEEYTSLYIELQKLFGEKNPKKLDSINVDLLTDGIAQRNIIREGLKSQITMIPFVFRDRTGKVLSEEEDLDFVFVKDKANSYKLIVGCKRGIDEIEVPETFKPDQFQPDFLKIEKDAVTDTIAIPLKPAKNGTESYVTTIEIRKGPIDLPKKVATEEAQEQYKKEMRKKEREREERESRNRSYNPPPARSPSRSSESGGYGYVNVNH